MVKVVIIQRTLKFYRLPFYNLLKHKLEENGIKLILIYGKDDDIGFNDAELDWGTKIENIKINLFEKHLYYQPVLKYIHKADLVIVEQASKLVINYYLWFLNLIGYRKLAFWGHGIDFQSNSSRSISELVKRIMTRKVHWFFAYTGLSKRVLETMGYPSERITTVNNTIDVEHIFEERKKWCEKDINRIREQLGVQNQNVCLFVGGMYKEKRLDFLIESLLLVRKKILDLQFIFIGEGPEKEKIINVAKKERWIHYLGFKDNIEKIPYTVITKLLVIPSLVGLSIIDSFVSKLPLVTTNSIGHGPEIDYLENGINGIMTDNTIAAYSSTIIDLLQNEEKRLMLAEGCQRSAMKYNMTSMVNNYYCGIVGALNISIHNRVNMNV
jgi:L-malate glycosyltransferase